MHLRRRGYHNLPPRKSDGSAVHGAARNGGPAASGVRYRGVRISAGPEEVIAIICSAWQASEPSAV